MIALPVLVATRQRLVPLDIDSRNSPSVRFEGLRHALGVLQGPFFRRRRAETIPGVPAHRRRSSPLIEFAFRRRGGCGLGLSVRVDL